ncbi:MAG: DivIVA domain-containing protein [Bacteroidetes bacterium]|nr:DivIVA domain-containing protein [Bacteroidota bacterium]MBU2505632.1 DivIVA domain-containing protein [Bacteroidota bacterium]
MKFTPYNIKNQEFNKAVRGYDRDEVKAFLEAIADDYDRLLQANQSLSKEFENQTDEIREFKKLEKSLQNTLLNAQESSSKSLESAKKQNQLIIKEAEIKSAQMLEKAKEEADSLRDAVLKLREEKILIVARIKALIETQSGLLDMTSAQTDLPDEKFINKSPESKSDVDVDDILEKLL